MNMQAKLVIGTAALATAAAFCQVAWANDGRAVGEVETAWKMMGPNHKIKIVGFEDPDISGVTCFVSRSVKGGVTGWAGLAEDTSDASVACRQTGPITRVGARATSTDPKGIEVFSEKRSMVFKHLRVTRHFDQPSGCWTYLTWSEKLIDGSAKNSLSAVCPQVMQPPAAR
jgi:CreA protein